MIKIAHVSQIPPREAGFIVLVTRKWPRGVQKDAIHKWEKELGGSPELLKEYKKGKITLAGFQARYIGEVSEPGRRALLDELQRRAMNGQDLILVCDSDDEQGSVRNALKMILETT